MGSPVWKRASARCDFPLQSRPHAEPVSTATLLGRESALETSGLGCASTLGSWSLETCWFQSGEPDGETWVGSREGAACLVCSGGGVRFFLNWGLGVFPMKCSMHVNIFNNHLAIFSFFFCPFRLSRITSLRYLRITRPVLKSTHKE